MAICPNGHDSVAEDFCDACGTRIASSPGVGSVRVVGKHHAGGPRPAGSPSDTCPWCGRPSSGQFCAHCGFRVRRPFAPLAEPRFAAGSQPADGSQLPAESQPVPESQPLPDSQPVPEPQSAPEPRAWPKSQPVARPERSFPSVPAEPIEPPARSATPPWSAGPALPANPDWHAATSWSAIPASSSDQVTSPAPAVSSVPPDSLFPPVPRPDSLPSPWPRPHSPSPLPATSAAEFATPDPPELAGTADVEPTSPRALSPASFFTPVTPDPVSPAPSGSVAPPDTPYPEDLPASSERPAFLDWFRSPDPAESSDLAVPSESPEPWAPPEQHAPADAPAPDSYSWSARADAPSPSAPHTTPMPKFTPVTWSVEVAADRTYYNQMQADRARMGWDLPFPVGTTERRFPLTGQQMRIGRRSAARTVEPEIDLSGPPVDPGISRLHALLLSAPDGSWAVLDPGSANGTLLNGREIAPGDLIPLRDGDRINLGAWTAITVRRD
jgi:hypothetical protein